MLVSVCSSWMARPDTKYQNSWPQTLYLYMLLHWTGHRLELKRFHFTQFWLNAVLEWSSPLRGKKWIFMARNLQSMKTCLTLKLCHYSKSGSTFHSSKLVAARSDCHRLGSSLLLCLPAWPARGPKLCRRAAARALPLMLQSKPSIIF